MDSRQFEIWDDEIDKQFLGASDRAVAVVGASMMDAQLRLLFEAKITQNSKKHVLFDGANAPLHSMSGKTELALALGMISLREYRNLTLIRKIRNEFAHEIGILSFNTQKIANRCGELEVPVGMRLPSKIPAGLVGKDSDPSELPPMPFETPREQFQVAVLYVSKCLFARKIEVMKNRAEVKPEFERTSEVWDVYHSASNAIINQIHENHAQVTKLSEQYKHLTDLTGKTVDNKTREKDSEIRKHVQQLEEELQDIQHDDAYKVLVLTQEFSQYLVEFIRRWERWAESIENLTNHSSIK